MDALRLIERYDNPDVLMYLDASLRARGRPPTVREIADAEGITVKNAYGYIKRIREGYEKEAKRLGRHENP